MEKIKFTFEDTKVYDEKIYTKNEWNGEVNNYASAGDQLYGLLMTTGQNTSPEYRTDGADATMYSNEFNDYIVKWYDKSFIDVTFNGNPINWNSQSGGSDGLWKVLDKNGKDITYNYNVVFEDVYVEITQQPVQVYWSGLNQQFEFNNPVKLPTVQTIYSPKKLPIKVQIFDLEGNEVSQLQEAFHLIGNFYLQLIIPPSFQCQFEDGQLYLKLKHYCYFLLQNQELIL